MSRAHRIVSLAGAAFLIMGAAVESHAIESLGPRLGVRLDPNQVVLGGQANLWQPSDNIRIGGTLALGLGDGTTLLGLTPEIHYIAAGSPLADGVLFYVGAGIDLAAAWVSQSGSTTSSTDLGPVLLGGVERHLPSGTGVFGEFRLILHDPTDWFEIVGGVNFSLVR